MSAQDEKLMRRFIVGRAIEDLSEIPYSQLSFITGEPEIGDGTWIGAFTVLDGQGGLIIGRGVDIACGAAILTHSSVKRCVTERRYPHVERASVKIGDYVFIGENAVILMGSEIGDHSVVAAGAVVLENSKIPAYSLVAGVPAKVVRDIREQVADWSEH